MEYWNIGMMRRLEQFEHGDMGMLVRAKNRFFPNVPTFRHSNIPLFHFFIPFVLLTMSVLWLPGGVHADMWDLASRFQVYISAQEEYSDNIELNARSKTGDFITTLSPGLKFSTLPRTRVAAGEFRKTPGQEEENFGLEGDYHPGFVFYAKDTNRNFTSHAGTLNAWYIRNKRLTFRVRDVLVRSEEPREQDFSQNAIPGQFLLGGTDRNRSIYFRNVFEPSLEYKFGKENVLAVNYRSNIYENQDPDVQDSREDYVSPRISYWFDIRNGASLEYGLTLGHFEGSPVVVAHPVRGPHAFIFGGIDGSPDFVGHSMKGRYTYRLDPKTSVFGDYSFVLRDFDAPRVVTDPPTFPPPAAPSQDYVVHTPTVGVDRVLSPTLTAKAQVGYFWQVPAQGSKQSGPFYDVSLTNQGERTSLTLSLKGGYTEDFFTAENLGFTKTHRAIGVMSYRLAEKLTLGLTGSYDRITSGPDGKESIWEAGSNLSYQVLRWLTLYLNVTHRENHSNLSAESFTENRAVFRLMATY
jgi:hypothetical protein